MTGLDEVANIDINTTAYDEDKTQNLIHMAKRRRSSAASTRPSPQLAAKPPPGKKKHHGAPLIQLEQNKNTLTDTKFSTLRDVVLFALQAADNSPKYLKMKNRASLHSVVLLTTPGIDASKFGVYQDTESPCPLKVFPDELEFLSRHFQEFQVLSAPGDRESIYPLMKLLAIRPFSKSQKIRITNTLKETKLILPDLKMSFEDLATNDYPIHPLCHTLTPPSPTPEGWVDTIKFEHGGSHTFALDCEMCESSSGKVLARVSLIDFDDNIILDEYVKPSEEITDYLTQYSGITEEILAEVTTTLEDIQEKISTIISSDDYLIGHSLENDLKVMKIRHPNIVDTSIVFEHPRGPPYKSSLKYLTKQYLQRSIQGGEHDSVEDAKACLDLVKLKLLEGGLLGKVIDGQPIFDDLDKIEKKGVIIDQTRVQPHQDKYIQCVDEDDVMNAVIEKSKDHSLVIANIKADTDDLFALNKRLSTIYRHLEPNTLLIVASGSGDQNEMRQLASEKRSDPEKWTEEDEEKLRKVTKATRLGVCFFKIVQ